MAKTITDQAYKDEILIYHNHTQVTISFIDETIEGFCREIPSYCIRPTNRDR